MKLQGGKYTEKGHFASFLGFTPVAEPAFVIMVGMDEPAVGFVPGKGMNHMGGTCSAPVFREIARRSLEYLGVVPDVDWYRPIHDPEIVGR